MKKIVSCSEPDEVQLNSIKSFAREISLSYQTAKILWMRGIDTRQKFQRFITAGKDYYISPFRMKGMKEAVELITQARDEGWSVAVFGDYDADGICSAVIMYEALERFGITPSIVYVPERKNDYGLNFETIDAIFEECDPQLFITVDCGITNPEEVAYIQEGGAEVIVTDHHVLQKDLLPDCITINPKFDDDYPYDNLCGTGVAFKVGIALNGESFYSFADIAAIATVADSVPLTGENRDIVKEGLKIINQTPRKCYSALLNNKYGDPVTAQTIMFSLAPKINAAGRMGRARDALRLFLSEDDDEIREYSEKLTEDNKTRQERCDELQAAAEHKLDEMGGCGRVVMLYDREWDSRYVGLIGIVAARLAEEYGRPTLLFVRDSKGLRGSARSVDGVNIYEMLRACSEYIDEFGGHEQAAGVRISEENFAALEKALNEYMDASYADVKPVPRIYVDGDSDGPFSAHQVRELDLLEPCGVGNKHPMFKTVVGACTTRIMKPSGQHISIRYKDFDFTCFYGVKYIPLIESRIPKTLVFEYSLSSFKGRDYVRGIVRDVVYDDGDLSPADDRCALNNLLALSYPEVSYERKTVTAEEVAEELAFGDDYGTIYLADSFETVKKFDNPRGLGHDLFYPSSGDPSSVILISPRRDVDLSRYSRIVWLCDPVKMTLPAMEGREAYVCEDECALPSPRHTRNDLVGIYRWVSSNYDIMDGINCEEVSKADSPYHRIDMLFALEVFEELGIISFEDGRLSVNRGVKTDLGKSDLYVLIDGRRG